MLIFDSIIFIIIQSKHSSICPLLLFYFISLKGAYKLLFFVADFSI
jgi:hypothetical protein